MDEQSAPDEVAELAFNEAGSPTPSVRAAAAANNQLTDEEILLFRNPRRGRSDTKSVLGFIRAFFPPPYGEGHF